MSMCRCPKCGEMYSTSYKTCPFCEEDDAWAEGRPVQRKGNGRRVASRKEPSILGPFLVVVILLLVGVLVYFLFGDKIADTLGLGQTEPPSVMEPQPSSGDDGDSSLTDPEDSTIEPPVVGDTGDGTGDGTGQTGNTGDTGDTGSEMSFEQVAKLPLTLTLNQTDFTRKVSEGTIQLKVKDGGTGYSWISEDEGVASVDENGLVTPISNGDITIMAYSDTGRGACIVRVRGSAAVPATGGATVPATGELTGTATENTSTKDAKLNKSDFTLPIGDPPVQLEVSGTTAAITWSSSKPEVATVSSTGQVTAVGKGITYVTATVGNTKLSCIVRVNK